MSVKASGDTTRAIEMSALASAHLRGNNDSPVIHQSRWYHRIYHLETRLSEDGISRDESSGLHARAADNTTYATEMQVWKLTASRRSPSIFDQPTAMIRAPAVERN